MKFLVARYVATVPAPPLAALICSQLSRSLTKPMLDALREQMTLLRSDR